MRAKAARDARVARACPCRPWPATRHRGRPGAPVDATAGPPRRALSRKTRRRRSRQASTSASRPRTMTTPKRRHAGDGVVEGRREPRVDDEARRVAEASRSAAASSSTIVVREGHAHGARLRKGPERDDCIGPLEQRRDVAAGADAAALEREREGARPYVELAPRHGALVAWAEGDVIASRRARAASSSASATTSGVTLLTYSAQAASGSGTWCPRGLERTDDLPAVVLDDALDDGEARDPTPSPWS